MYKENPLKKYFGKRSFTVFHSFFNPIISNGSHRSVPQLVDWEESDLSLLLHRLLFSVVIPLHNPVQFTEWQLCIKIRKGFKWK